MSTSDSPKISIGDWVQERLENSARIAATKIGSDRAGWIEDAAYYLAIKERIAELEADNQNMREELRSKLYGMHG